MTETAIIMSVYNEDQYIKDSIESILNQTYKKWVFYIMVDGAIDNTYNICMDYDELSNIIVYSRKENKGLAKSLNDLIKIVKRDYPKIKYIARQDGDDLSYCDRLETQIKFLNKYKDYGMCGTFNDIIDQDGKIFNNPKSPVSNYEIRADLFNDNPFCHGSIVYRASIFKDMEYDEDFIRCQDYELYTRIIKKYKVANIPEVLYSWRNGNKFHSMLNVRKYFVGLARYKMYCAYMEVPYNKDNYKENHFQ